MDEFNLSEKINDWLKVFIEYGYIGKNDIKRLNEIHKEFIKRLKEDTGCRPINSREKQIIELFKERIDKLAGDELNGK